MKKVYIAPVVQVVRMEMHQMVCGSIKEEGNNLNVNINGDDTFDDNETINARGFSFIEDDPFE